GKAKVSRRKPSRSLRLAKTWAVLRATSTGRRLWIMAHLTHQFNANGPMMRVDARWAILSGNRPGRPSMRDRRDARRYRTPMRRRIFCPAALFLGLVQGAAAQTAVDLQLALMVDASGSVNQYRFELQKRGYVAALRNPRILGAVLGGRTQSIAISMVQWTGPVLQVVVLPWTQLKDEASVMSAAAIVEKTPRQLFGGGTSISGAIDYAMAMFPESPFKAERQVIDISGDGSNNGGRSVVRARNEAVEKGVTING